MRTTHLTIVLAACLAALAAIGPSAHAQPTSIAENARSAALTTGGGYAAFLAGPRTIRVLDTFADTAYDAELPSTCADPVQLAAVGGDQALVNCTDRPEISVEDEPLLLDLVRRNWHEPVGAAFLKRLRQNDSSARLDAVGLRWLSGEWHQYQGYGRFFLDWRTGRTVEGDGDYSVMPNLDAADVLVPLCNPFGRQRHHPTYEGPAFIDFPYDPPYRVAGTHLQRCGTSRPGLPLDTSEQVLGMQLSDSYASWYVQSRRPSLRAYLPLCGVRYSWPLAHVIAVVHTARQIYVTTSPDGKLGPSLRVMRQARPGCPDLTRPNAVVVSRDHRYAGTSLITAHWPTGSEGAPALLAAPGNGSATLPAGEGRAHVQAAMKLQRVRWRIGIGPWKSATGRGRAWTLGTLGSGVLTIKVRTLDGANAQYAVSVR
jgi:hypothetical protein